MCYPGFPSDAHDALFCFALELAVSLLILHDARSRFPIDWTDRKLFSKPLLGLLATRFSSVPSDAPDARFRFPVDLTTSFLCENLMGLLAKHFPSDAHDSRPRPADAKTHSVLMHAMVSLAEPVGPTYAL